MNINDYETSAGYKTKYKVYNMAIISLCDAGEQQTDLY